jgi:uncharacterized membrane protein
MKNKKIYQIAVTAMLAALTCVATMVIRIPSPMEGYVNLGDTVVGEYAMIMGPLWGAAAGGIGSMLADVLSGYAHYAPGTLVIKSLMVVVAWYTAYGIRKTGHRFLGEVGGSIVAELVMVVGYFGYASLLLGKGLAAAASIPGNLVQGAIGAVVSLVLVVALEKVGAMKKMNSLVG